MRTVRAYWASSKTLVLLTHCSAVSTFNLVYNRTIITYVHISIIKGHLYHNFLAQRQQNSVVHTVLYRSTCTDPTCYDSVCVYAAPSVSDKQPLCQIGSKFSGAKRTRGSFLKQTPSAMMRRNSSLTPNTASTTATPTPVGVSTGRGFVFQKGVAKPPSSSGSNQVSNFKVMDRVHVRPPTPKTCI